ncbi:class I adenylate-forming enzyme family protein [Elioraea rosea]|uniref:class I adenylate-forming enzyme family protein n=1 Tax=Elioraea rosea TaxID=2492390 RepID=UPI0011821284|nr:AMP-binding protein [Elioraea rosea]
MSDRLAPLEVIRRFRAHDFTLADFLAARVEARPEDTFLVFEGRSWSYAAFAREVARLAAWLAAKGVRAGDRIGVLSTNHPTTAALLFATARLGAIMVPANPDYGPAEAGYVFGHAGISGLVAGPGQVAVAVAAIGGLSPSPWVVLNEEAEGAALPTLEAGTQGLDAADVPPACGGADDTCLLIYTSGTTGFPKGVMHAQRSVVLTGEAFVGRMHLQPDDRLMCVLPLFHINALFYSLCGGIACGGSVALVRRFSASGFWRTAAETGATEVNLMAAAARILMLRDRSEFVAGHRLRKAFIAPLTAEMHAAFTGPFGLSDIIECYGMTEIPGVIGNPFAGERRLGSMGMITPHPDPAIARPEARIVDEDFRDAPANVPGALVVRTPTIMQGYWHAPEATRDAFRDGWFLTGDIARRDEDGYFHFVARAKDIIRRRGENVSGAELDRVVTSHPAVAEAATIGVPSAMGDEDILVAIVPRPGAAPRAEEIAEHVRARLAAFKVPRYVAFVDALPQTATQRIEKYKLKQDPTLLARAVDLEAAAARAER